MARDDAVVCVEWRAVVREVPFARDDHTGGLQRFGERDAVTRQRVRPFMELL